MHWKKNWGHWQDPEQAAAGETQAKTAPTDPTAENSSNDPAASTEE